MENKLVEEWGRGKRALPWVTGAGSREVGVLRWIKMAQQRLSGT